MKKSLKNIIATILVSIAIISCSTSKIITKKSELGINRTELHFKNNSIEVDNVLLPYVEEFVEEAIKYNINVDSISKNFLGIYVEYTPKGTLGVTYKQQPEGLDFCLIAPIIAANKKKARLIVFHELAHAYMSRTHCHKFCREIMSANISVHTIYNDWNNQKKIFFKEIKHNAIQW